MLIGANLVVPKGGAAPLPLVLYEEGQTIATGTLGRVKCVVQSAGDGHVRAESLWG
jgi:hypothetical protein